MLRLPRLVNPLLGAVLGHFSAVIVLSLWYGFQYLVASEWHLPYYGSGAVAFGLSLLLVARGLYDSTPVRRSAVDWIATGNWLIAISLSLTFYFNSKLTLGGLGGLLPIATAGVGHIVHKPAASVKLQLGLAWLGLCWIALGTPNDPRAANMLPNVEAFCEDLIGGDVNPFLTARPEITSFHFFYLPALIAPYCPLQWAGIDVRIFNCIALSVTLLWLFRSLNARTQLGPYAVAVVPLFVSPVMAQMMAHGHLWAYWLVIIGLAVAFHRGRFLLTAALLGVALGMRQLAIFLAAPALAWLVRHGSARQIVSSSIVALAVWFVAASPALLYVSDFVGHFYTRLATESAERQLVEGPALVQVSASALLLTFFARSVVQMIQMLVVAIMCGMAATTHFYSRDHALAFIGLAYTVAVAFTPWVNRYFYVTGLLLVSIALANLLLHQNIDENQP